MSRIEDLNNIYKVIKIIKNSGEEPTIPSSNYKSDGSWSNTDIYNGQIAINIPDKKVWYRSNDDIIELTSSASTIYDDFDSHTGDTTNPHETSFDNLTNTAHTHDWVDITDTPTTLSGYGIEDAYTQDEVENNYDNYQYWNLKTNGVQRKQIQSGNDLDISGGTNTSISYGAGGVVTINSDDTTYTSSDFDHNDLQNTHNLTTDIDHNSLTNTHNLTTDIDHDQLTNFVSDEHIDWTTSQTENIHPDNYTDTNSIDYIGEVALNNLNLIHNGTGNAFNDNVDLSPVANYYWTSGSSGTNSITLANHNNTSTGNYSVAQGFRVTASGAYSHAEGYETTSSDSQSHAEGFYTTASGSRSHAENSYTIASGTSSHAGGYGTEDFAVVSAGDSAFNHSATITKISNNEGTYSSILGGADNVIGDSRSCNIIGGETNTVDNNSGQSSILGGNTNFIDEEVFASSIIGGENNIISAGVENGVILGGSNINLNEDDMVYAPNYKVMKDNNTDNFEYVPMIVHYSGSTPPAASNYPMGTILIKYE